MYRKLLIPNDLLYCIYAKASPSRLYPRDFGKGRFSKSVIFGKAFKNVGNSCTFLFQKPWEFKYLIEWTSEESISMTEMEMNFRMIK